MGSEKRKSIFEQERLTLHLATALKLKGGAARTVENTLESFDKLLEKFGSENGVLDARKEYILQKFEIVMKDLGDLNIYTSLDRFLQFLFSNSDDILRNVFNPESKDGIDASNLLKRVYKGKFNDHMQAFLRRDLREDILRDWDQNDPELLEKGEKQENKETQILPVVDYASASGDDQPK